MTAPKPKPQKKSIKTVTGVELAEWICVTPGAVTRMAGSGRIEQDKNGLYPLKTTIQKIIMELRARNVDKKADKKDLDRSLKFWQCEAQKQKVLSWRLQYGKELALAVIQSLDDALNEFQNKIGDDEQINAAILQLSTAIKAVNIEQVVYGVDDEDIEEVTTLTTE